MHFGVQARLVHHGIDSAGHIHLEETGISLLPPNRQHEIGRKIYLVPSGFKGYESHEGTIVTTDADAFWAAPVKAVL